jgi:ankyrin repeat protein
MAAVEASNIDAVKLIVARGANVNWISYFAERYFHFMSVANHRPIHMAAELPKTEILSFLIQSGAEINNFVINNKKNSDFSS